MTKQSDLKSRVYKFYRMHVAQGKSFIWAHFKAEGAAKTTIYRLMKSCEENRSEERKKGSGRRPTINTSVDSKL
jgi:hypothetical protein